MEGAGLKKLVLLFERQEISLILADYELLMADGRPTGLKADPSTMQYLRYVNWERVIAVLEYDIKEENMEYGAEKD